MGPKCETRATEQTRQRSAREIKTQILALVSFVPEEQSTREDSIGRICRKQSQKGPERGWRTLETE